MVQLILMRLCGGQTTIQQALTACVRVRECMRARVLYLLQRVCLCVPLLLIKVALLSRGGVGFFK